MNIFNKIITKKNDKISYYKFSSKKFTSEQISKLCLKTQIANFFIEIYGLTQKQKNIIVTKTKLLDKKIEVFMNPINQNNLISFCIPVLRMKDFLTYTIEIDFDEILIWDCYTTIDQFLKKDQNKIDLKKDDCKFFLNYNRYENNYVELYLDPVVDSPDIYKLVSK